MPNGILGQIASPQIANVPEAFASGQEQALQQRRLDIQSQLAEQQLLAQQQQLAARQMAGQLLGDSMGGRLGSIAQADPEIAVSVAETLGIPINETQRLESFAGDVQIASTLADIDAEQSIQFIDDAVQRRKDLGIDTTQMEQFSQQIKSDPREGILLLRQLKEGMQDAGLLQETPEDARRNAKVRAFAPISAINPETGEKILVSPTVDDFGNPSISKFSLPDGFQIAKETGEERRAAEAIAAGEKETRKGLAKQGLEIRKAVFKDAEMARKQIPELERVLAALDAVETGAVAQAKKLLGPFIPGVDPTDEQALASQLNQFALDKLDAFTGAISEGEREFARQTVANLGFTNEANRQIIRNRLRTLRRSVGDQDRFKRFTAEGNLASDFIRFENVELAQQRKVEKEQAQQAITAERTALEDLTEGDLRNLSDAELQDLLNTVGR